MLICGIDEAGRGPVIGPMVISAVSIEDGIEEEFADAGITDSKLLDKTVREKLFELIEDKAKEIKTIILNPLEIDEWMGVASLNDLEAVKSAEIIDSLKFEPEKCFLDCPDTIMERYSKNISNLCKGKSEIIAEHKADLNRVVVAAASIIAKVTRDWEIEKIKETHGEVGSGYPSDAITQKWLEVTWSEERCFPDCVRKKWHTIDRIAQLRINEW